jgi:hypothetical protein
MELQKQVEEFTTNKFFFEMDGRPITLVPLTPKQLYDEHLKLKKGKMDLKGELVYQGNLIC